MLFSIKLVKKNFLEMSKHEMSYFFESLILVYTKLGLEGPINFLRQLIPKNVKLFCLLGCHFCFLRSPFFAAANV